MDYINNSSAEPGCIFCPISPERSDRDRLILARSDYSLIMLNRYPYTGGHLMVAPLRHTAEPDDLSDTELLDMFRSIRIGRSLLRRVAKPDGFNIGINLGKAAGAGVEDHLHVHIVPRWNGDSNFMTVVGDVRVIPEGLLAAYDQLSAALAEIS
jgi:ATP adenylyltransferase